MTDAKFIDRRAFVNQSAAAGATLGLTSLAVGAGATSGKPKRIKVGVDRG